MYIMFEGQFQGLPWPDTLMRILTPVRQDLPLKELIARTGQEPGSLTHDPAPLHLFHPCLLHLFI